jgi:hypothetical protein
MIKEADVLAAVTEIIKQIDTPDDSGTVRIENGSQETNVITLVKRRSKLMRDRERLMNRYLDGRIDRDNYLAQYKRIEAEIQTLPATTSTVKQLEQAHNVLMALPDQWSRSDNNGKRDLLEHVMCEIYIDVDTHKIVSFKPQPVFADLFSVDSDGLVGAL